ncbi:hypothetical protein VNI00_011185 [Paramarasmius palmivorus]|uniref:Uncharacterized protein n=1 Tax=Paramarasmius palmivorus TaxID=297713 RepID=A0AAW0CH89_9AGAR
MSMITLSANIAPLKAVFFCPLIIVFSTITSPAQCLVWTVQVTLAKTLTLLTMSVPSAYHFAAHSNASFQSSICILCNHPVDRHAPRIQSQLPPRGGCPDTGCVRYQPASEFYEANTPCARIVYRLPDGSPTTEGTPCGRVYRSHKALPQAQSTLPAPAHAQAQRTPAPSIISDGVGGRAQPWVNPNRTTDRSNDRSTTNDRRVEAARRHATSNPMFAGKSKGGGDMIRLARQSQPLFSKAVSRKGKGKVKDDRQEISIMFMPEGGKSRISVEHLQPGGYRPPLNGHLLVHDDDMLPLGNQLELAGLRWTVRVQEDDNILQQINDSIVEHLASRESATWWDILAEVMKHCKKVKNTFGFDQPTLIVGPRFGPLVMDGHWCIGPKILLGTGGPRVMLNANDPQWDDLSELSCLAECSEVKNPVEPLHHVMYRAIGVDPVAPTTSGPTAASSSNTTLSTSNSSSSSTPLVSSTPVYVLSDDDDDDAPQWTNSLQNRNGGADSEFDDAEITRALQASLVTHRAEQSLRAGLTTEGASSSLTVATSNDTTPSVLGRRTRSPSPDLPLEARSVRQRLPDATRVLAEPSVLATLSSFPSTNSTITVPSIPPSPSNSHELKTLLRELKGDAVRSDHLSVQGDENVTTQQAARAFVYALIRHYGDASSPALTGSSVTIGLPRTPHGWLETPYIG